MTLKPGCKLGWTLGSCGWFERLGIMGDRRYRVLETMINRATTISLSKLSG
jgi:hypothetical protein